MRYILSFTLAAGLGACANLSEPSSSGLAARPEANMSAPVPAISAFMGEVIMFGGDFCPQGTLDMQGEVSASQNGLLFSILRESYPVSGNRVQLPQMRGSAPVGHGHGPGLPDPTNIPDHVGEDQIFMTEDTLPEHYHYVWASDQGANSPSPENGWLATWTSGPPRYAGGAANVPMQDHPDGGGHGTIGPAVDRHDNPANGAPFSNVAPSQVIRFCMVANGVAPSR